MSLGSDTRSQPCWIFDRDAAQYFWYDARTDTLVYADGARVRRPVATPTAVYDSNEAYQHWYNEWPPGSSYLQPYDSMLMQDSRVANYRETPGLTPTSTAASSDGHSYLNPPSLSAVSRAPQDLASAFQSLSFASQARITHLNRNNPDGRPQPSVPARDDRVSPYIANRESQRARQTTLDPRRRDSGLDQGLSLATAQPRRARDATQGSNLTNQQDVRMPTPVNPRVIQDDKRRMLEVVSPESGVRTLIQTAPREDFTDPQLLKKGITSTSYLLGTQGEEELLFEGFRVRTQPRKFFTLGKVFLVLWVEPMGQTVVTNIQPGFAPPQPPGVIPSRFGESAYSKVRRFVVIREGDFYCSALPITTYGGQGTSKTGVNKSEHGIIHTGKKAPEPLPSEQASRAEPGGMRPIAIRVDPDQPDGALDPLSRVDYGKVHTIQHNIKAKSFGKVNRNSEAALQHQFASVWAQLTRLNFPRENPTAFGGTRGESSGAEGSRSRARRPSSGIDSSAASRSSIETSSMMGAPIPGRTMNETNQFAELSVNQANTAQQYERAIVDLLKRGYPREQAMQILRGHINRQRQNS